MKQVCTSVMKLETTNESISQKMGGVRRFSSTVAACVLALTVGAVVLMTPATVDAAAGQVLGGLTTENTAPGDGSVVVGGGKAGEPNMAEGENSVVVGGSKNTAEGPHTAIVGGYKNIVHEEIHNGAILGGHKNQIEAHGGLVGNYATISGGEDNIAYGEASSISGGTQHGTYGKYSSIAGGRGNNAGGEVGSVIGGSINNADGLGATLAGGLGNTGSGMWSTVFGGSQNESAGLGAAILGGGGKEIVRGRLVKHKNTSIGEYATIAGARDAMAVGNGSTVVGGSKGLTLGAASTSIGGGFTGTKAESSIAIGHKAGSLVKYGTAVGHESVATVEGTIAFGHDAGDVSGYTVKYPDKEVTTHLGAKKTVPDYEKTPTITETKYTEAKYNRLVKVADGVDAHDAVTVGQLEAALGQLQSTGANLETSVNQGTASSYALAALQPNFSEGETGLGLAVGFGHYHGQSAAALGAFYRPNQTMQWNLGAVIGKGNQGFNGGFSIKVGPETKKTVDASTDARIAQLERRILELEQGRR